MSERTTDQKTEMAIEAKRPIALKDNELDRVEGGLGLAKTAGVGEAAPEIKIKFYRPTPGHGE